VSDLEDLEEIAGQTSSRANGKFGGLFGWAHSPTIERASAARESKAIAVLQPAAIEPPPIATPQFQAAEIVCYSELIASLRDRVGQLGVRYLDFDKLASFAEGLTGKAFGAAQVKRLGVDKLFDALRAAGLRLRIEEDPEQTAKMKARIEQNFNPRQVTQARMGNRSHLSNKMIDEVLNYLANRKGGLTVLNAAVKEARSNMARHGAKALWEKRRADGPVDFATYLGNSQLSPPALRPPEEPGSSTNPCSTEAAA
jgi:hypothetical protein